MRIVENHNVVYTVSQLNLETRLLLEECFKTIWITGELSNLSRPSSGHWYFSLKDSQSQIRCAFFRNYQHNLSFVPKNGLQVLVQAEVSLYETRGEYQLIVQQMELSGKGNLHIAFEQLKQRLSAEGLFDTAHKKIIPTIPHTIGVITSQTGAALQDILKVLRRRAPHIPIMIYPTSVQGDAAAAQIVSAVKTANAHPICDVLLLARGGGSLEDLWPFNEEIVARAIFASHIPVITGIGHEIDYTIADFVADARAATPSAAAEQVSPDRTAQLQQLMVFHQRLQYLITTQLRHDQLQLQSLQKRLQHPSQRLQHVAQQLDQLERRLILSIQHCLISAKQQLSNLQQSLHTISPQATLQRGYAIIQNPSTKEILRDTKSTHAGDAVIATLAQGNLTCRVEQIHEHSVFQGQ